MVSRKEGERMNMEIKISIIDKILSYEYESLKNRRLNLNKLNINEVKK